MSLPEARIVPERSCFNNFQNRWVAQTARHFVTVRSSESRFLQKNVVSRAANQPNLLS